VLPTCCAEVMSHQWCDGSAKQAAQPTCTNHAQQRDALGPCHRQLSIFIGPYNHNCAQNGAWAGAQALLVLYCERQIGWHAAAAIAIAPKPLTAPSHRRPFPS